MKLYDLKNAPNPRRVKIFLAEKKISLPIEALDIESTGAPDPAFLAKNPSASCRCWSSTTARCSAKSIAICRYFEEMVPEPPLFGRSTLERAQVEMWNRRMEHELLLPVIDVFVHTHPFWVGKREQLPVWGEAQRKVLVERMRWLDGELRGQGVHRRRALRHGRHHRPGGAADRARRGQAADPGGPQEPARWWASVTKRPTARA